MNRLCGSSYEMCVSMSVSVRERETDREDLSADTCVECG